MGASTDAGRRGWKRNLGRLYAWLPVLQERQAQYAVTLSGGEQQMLAIGRGLASAPKLLMLDEPSMRLAPAIADFIFDRLMEIRRESNMTNLLVDKRVAEARRFADHGYVRSTGTVWVERESAALRATRGVREEHS